FKSIKRWFQTMTRQHTKAVDAAQAQLNAAFAFLEAAFGSGQEMVLFMTQLTANAHSLSFIETWGNEAYFRHNQELLVYDVRRKLTEEIDALEL
ncbi:MAG: ATPase, partial [Deltaproteobacteria bacterium]|nr:ATPase [Deltaproteobacteria bacterium]